MPYVCRCVCVYMLLFLHRDAHYAWQVLVYEAIVEGVLLYDFAPSPVTLIVDAQDSTLWFLTSFSLSLSSLSLSLSLCLGLCVASSFSSIDLFCVDGGIYPTKLLHYFFMSNTTSNLHSCACMCVCVSRMNVSAEADAAIDHMARLSLPHPLQSQTISYSFSSSYLPFPSLSLSPIFPLMNIWHTHRPSLDRSCQDNLGYIYVYIWGTTWSSICM